MAIYPMVWDCETSISKTKIHAVSSKNMDTDIYTLITGTHPNEIKIEHKEEGYKRTIDDDAFSRSGINIVVGHNLSFDLGYIWHTKAWQQYIRDEENTIWDTSEAEYILTGQRHKYASLAELQEKYLGKKTKEDKISKLFKHSIGADQIIAARLRCPRLFKLYNLYCREDGATTLRIFSAQYKEAKRLGMLKLIQARMKGLLAVFLMQNTGINIDVVGYEETLRDFKMKSLDYLSQAIELTKHLWDDRLGPFNINSPKQKSAMLFGGDFVISERVEDGKFKNGNTKYKKVEKTIHIEGLGVPKSWAEESKIEGRWGTGKDVIHTIHTKCKDPLVIEYCELQKKSMNYGKMCSTYLEPFLKFSIDGVLYPNYNTNATETSRLSSSSPNMQNCVSDDTEVLTPRGWVLFPELLPSDEVFQVCPTTEIGNFVKPLQIIKNRFEGNLVAVSADWGEFLYTEEHNLISYNRKSGCLIKDTAKDWLRKWEGTHNIDRKMLRAGFKVGGCSLDKEQRAALELAVIVQADGCLDTRSKHPHVYDVSCRSTRKIRQLEKLGRPLVYNDSGRVRCKVVYSEISEWLDDTKEKNFLPSILKHSFNDLVYFFELLHKWDGDNTRNCAYGQKRSKRKASLDIAQAVGAMIGKSTSYYTHPTKDFNSVNFHRKAARAQSVTTVTRVPYKGDVYCVTVPTGAFLIRRNGAVVVTGNCPASGEMLVPIQGQLIAPEGWVCVDIDYSSLEPWVTALITGDKNLARDLLGGICLHCRAVSWIPRLSQGKSYEEIYQLAVVDKHPKWVLARKKAKGVNFKRAYGGGAKSLAEAEGLDIEDVKAVFASQEEEYHGVKDFTDRLYANLKENEKLSREKDFSKSGRVGRAFSGGIELLPIFDEKGNKTYLQGEFRHFGTYTSPWGHRFTFEENGRLGKFGRLRRAYSTTETRNYQIQGSAGDIVEAAMAECMYYVLGNSGEVRMVRQIHDALSFYIKKGTEHTHIPALCAILKDIKHLLRKYLGYEAAFNFQVEAKVGTNFAQTEVYNLGESL